MSNIILIGMPGAGKSTIGVLLAKSMGYNFLDTDLIIQSQQKKKLQQIIDEEGIDAFLKCEERALLSIDFDCTVVATGGSAIFSEKGMEHLKKEGVCVYLKVDEQELIRRLSNIKTRGIACRKGETVAEIIEERRAYYEKYADVTINCESATAEQMVERIIESI
ncbi:MAG: shikimate kinase [Ruminiclostridium sp.]|nr:shikimate kinase [Ruminiclostridium sp.]